MILARIFSKKWLFATLLVVAASLVMARLGMWQLDRLTLRRAFNARVLQWVEGEMLVLAKDTMDEDLYNMEYRPVTVTGDYVFSDQVVLRNRQFGNQVGYSLLTPLQIEGTNQAILVERGWIPQVDGGRDNWSVYDVEGTVTVRGVLRRPQESPDYGPRTNPTLMPGQIRLDSWWVVNLELISEQVSLSLLTSAYIQESPADAEPEAPPFPISLDLQIDEGPHMGYAVQWFTFAVILLVGYPFFVRNQDEREKQELKEEEHGKA